MFGGYLFSTIPDRQGINILKNHRWSLAGLGIRIFLANWRPPGINVGHGFFFGWACIIDMGKGWCSLVINPRMCIDKFVIRLLGINTRQIFLYTNRYKKGWCLPDINPSMFILTKLVIMDSVIKKKNQVLLIRGVQMWVWNYHITKTPCLLIENSMYTINLSLTNKIVAT
jgi:hypothetical protein